MRLIDRYGVGDQTEKCQPAGPGNALCMRGSSEGIFSNERTDAELNRCLTGSEVLNLSQENKHEQANKRASASDVL